MLENIALLALSLALQKPVTNSSAMVPPTFAIVRTNRPPTYSWINYQPYGKFFKPPQIGSDWYPQIWSNQYLANYTLQLSTNLRQWIDVPFSNITVSNYTWITYNSNFATHLVTPVSTNYSSNVWNVRSDSKTVYLRWKIQ